VSTLLDNLTRTYSEICYSDPDHPEDNTCPPEQADDSIIKTAPPNENMLIEPSMPSEPSEETAPEPTEENFNPDQDENDNNQNDNNNANKPQQGGMPPDNQIDAGKKKTGGNLGNTLANGTTSLQPKGLFESIRTNELHSCTLTNQSGQPSISSKGSLDLRFYGASPNISKPFGVEIGPNPYTLDLRPIVIKDNQNGDCSSILGDVSLPQVNFAFYTIKQIDESGDLIRTFQIPVNKQWPNIVVNVHSRNFSDIPKDFEIVPNQYVIQLKDEVTADTGEVASIFASKTNAKILNVNQNSKSFVFTINDDDVHKIKETLAMDQRLKAVEQNVVGRIAQLTNNQALSSGLQRVISGASQFALYSSAGTSIGQVDADIAILDTGIDLNHPDLNVYRNVTFVNGSVTGDDDNGHGSEVAGIAAAKNNMLGVVGMAPGARLWSIKVCAAAGNCPLANQLNGLEYAIAHADEIDVINISIENPFSSILNSTIERAIQKGIVVVAASGNDAQDAKDISPANSPHVIAVSGLADSDGKCGGVGPVTSYGQDDTLANFSNFGKVIDIASPAVDILTTYNYSDYSIDSGTSFAAPFVTGAAALIMSQNNNITVSQVRDQILNIGTSSVTKCDGKARGYFIDDPDSFRENVLYMNSTLSSNLIAQTLPSIEGQTQSVNLNESR
jgi:subtilisin family serine protease